MFNCTFQILAFGQQSMEVLAEVYLQQQYRKMYPQNVFFSPILGQFVYFIFPTFSP